MRGIGKLVRCLHHQSVARRQAHIVFQDAAEIRCELDGSRKAVLRPGERSRGKRQALGPQGQRPSIGRGALVAANTQPAFGTEDARSFHASVQKIRAADEARDERVGRVLVQVALRADLLHLTVGHDDQAIGHGQRLFLVVRDHHGGEPELLLQLADLDAHFMSQLGIEIGQRLIEQQDVGFDYQGARQGDALLLPA